MAWEQYGSLRTEQTKVEWYIRGIFRSNLDW